MQETAVRKFDRNDRFALTRLASYSRWPHLGKHSALAFAEAGFHYVGPGDEVACFCCQLTLGKWTQRMNPLVVHHQLSGTQCDFIKRRTQLSEQDSSTYFHCRGTVMNWPAGSVPWAEHSRRFLTRPFAVHVEDGQCVQEQLQRAGTCDILEDRDAQPATRFAVDLREIRPRMDSPMVRVLLRMDYPIYLVQEVIKNRLSTVGRDHETSEELLADVFAFHDEKQRSRTEAGLPAVVMPHVSTFPSSGDGAAHAGTNGSGQGHTSAPLIAPTRATDLALDAAVAMRESEQRSQPRSLLLSVAADSEQSVQQHNSEQSVQQQSSGRNPEEENDQLKSLLTCKVCWISLVKVIFLPCGHAICCATCEPRLSKCPLCRRTIRSVTPITF